MRPIDIHYIKRAVKSGQIEFFVQKDCIYVNDCTSGDCVKLGTVKGEADYEQEEKSD